MPRQSVHRHKIADLLYIIGLLLIVCSLGAFAFFPERFLGVPMMLGAVLYTISRAMASREALDIRSKRLHSMAFLSGVLFISGGYLFFHQTSYWRLVVTIASVLLLYSNIVLLYHKSSSNQD